MDVALLLILPIVGGYIFASNWIVTSYQIAREDGHRLYFRAAFYGVFLFSCGLLLRLLLLSAWDSYQQIESSLKQHLNQILKNPVESHQINTLLISLYALLLGAGAWYPLNFCSRPWRNRLLDWAVKDSDFEKLIQTAARLPMPILLTMDNEKVYVGYVVATMNPRHAREALTLLPLMSGYRNGSNKKIQFTTFYDSIYESLKEKHPKLSLKNFEIVLPTERIHSANMFDLSVYAEFQAQDPSQDDPLHRGTKRRTMKRSNK